MPRKVFKEIVIESASTRVFEALIKPNAICTWWSARSAIIIASIGGLYAVAWGEDMDDPDYINHSTISGLEENKKLTLQHCDYLAKAERLPFEATFEVDFALESIEKGTHLTVVQTGFPDDAIADHYFKGCQQGWEDVLKSIKSYCEKSLHSK